MTASFRKRWFAWYKKEYRRQVRAGGLWIAGKPGRPPVQKTYNLPAKVQSE